MKIPILMKGLMNSKNIDRILSSEDADPFSFSEYKYCYFGPNAKWLLSSVLNSLELKREDEIAIITTSDETYISICVSVTAFNYAKISRVITDSTKVVIVVHEFGFVIPNISNKINEWKSMGMIVIEDCAHVLATKIEEELIGVHGDYTIFSLPKIIPAVSGGLLKTSKELHLPPKNIEQQNLTKSGMMAAEKFIGKYKMINQFRQEREGIIKDVIKETSNFNIFEPSIIKIPYFVGVITDNKEKIIEKFVDIIEWGATLRNNLIYIPTNPLVDEKEYMEVIRGVFN